MDALGLQGIGGPAVGNQGGGAAVAAPAAAATANQGGGGGSWGASMPGALDWDNAPGSAMDIDSETTTFATVIASKIKDYSATPLARPRRANIEYELRETIASLRKKADGLEEALTEANKRVILPWNLFELAVSEIARLKAAVQLQEEEMVKIREQLAAKERIYVEPAPAPQLEDLHDLNITLPPFEEWWPTVAPTPIATKVVAPLKVVGYQFPVGALVGAGVALLVGLSMPKTWSKTRTFALGCSFGLAVRAFTKGIGR